MADKEVQGVPGVVEDVLDQSKAVDGGAVDGVQVGVVGLVAGVAGLAEWLGGKGMDDACLEADGGEGAAWGW